MILKTVLVLVLDALVCGHLPAFPLCLDLSSFWVLFYFEIMLLVCLQLDFLPLSCFPTSSPVSNVFNLCSIHHPCLPCVYTSLCFPLSLSVPLASLVPLVPCRLCVPKPFLMFLCILIVGLRFLDSAFYLQEPLLELKTFLFFHLNLPAAFGSSCSPQYNTSLLCIPTVAGEWACIRKNNMSIYWYFYVWLTVLVLIAKKASACSHFCALVWTYFPNQRLCGQRLFPQGVENVDKASVSVNVCFA